MAGFAIFFVIFILVSGTHCALDIKDFIFQRATSDGVFIQLKRFESLSHDFWMKVREIKEDIPNLGIQISSKLNRNPLVVKARDNLKESRITNHGCGRLFDSKLQNLIKETQLNVMVNLDKDMHDYDVSIDSVLTDIIDTRKDLERLLLKVNSLDYVSYDLIEKSLEKYIMKAQTGFNIISKLEEALPSTIQKSLSMSDEQNISSAIREILYDPVTDCLQHVRDSDEQSAETSFS